MVPEAPLKSKDGWKEPAAEGWFVLNARDARWNYSEGRGAYGRFEGNGELEFPQLGVHLVTLAPGEPMSMYHWEADQEDFLVLSGEALLIVEEEERPLRKWDFFHCPPNVPHTIVGVGTGPAAILAVGSRDNADGERWGGYPYSEVAMKHD